MEVKIKKSQYIDTIFCWIGIFNKIYCLERGETEKVIQFFNTYP